MLDAQGQEIKGIDYLLGTGKWEYLQTGVRVPQDGTLEVMAGTSGTGEAVYFDNLRVEQTGGLIVQEQHQYAYGSPLPGLSYTVGNRRYRYGYQGQYAEKDVETGFESFQLRLYNSRVGRWMNYDPYRQFDSPYVGMGNNTISGIDPTGGLSLSNLAKGLPKYRKGASAVQTAAKNARTVAKVTKVVGLVNAATRGARNGQRTASFSPAIPLGVGGLGSGSMAFPIIGGGIGAGMVGWQLGPWVNQHFDAFVNGTTYGLEWIGIPREWVEGPAKPILLGRGPKDPLPGDYGGLGTPNSMAERIGADGKLKQRRWYGPDGTPTLDKDFGHDHTGVGDPHMHDWAYPQPQAPNKKRGQPRPPTPTELLLFHLLPFGFGL